MKIFFRKVWFLLIISAMFSSIGTMIYLIETEQWIRAIKLFFYFFLGVSLAHFEVFEVIAWQWRRVFRKED